MLIALATFQESAGNQTETRPTRRTKEEGKRCVLGKRVACSGRETNFLGEEAEGAADANRRVWEVLRQRSEDPSPKATQAQE